ncbi:MAG: cyclic nucleotide-binding domain-containing protein [Candidatus Scalindua sp.]|jgi:CRP-like cAMP-binding protein|nr:cyclic nucleotide-binding domain-containing protein [Candidatus Scalindua sp.]MDV5165926.1 cyclic nucleotide-binding domain-containing protein [Candidatus Scalindua sp.]
MKESSLEKTYQNGDVIIRQGENGEHMHVIQSGQVEVIHEKGDNTDNPFRITVLGEGDFFGTVPLFGRAKSMGKVRSTIKALGDVQIITVGRKTLYQKINEDPSLAYRILETVSRRASEMEYIISRQPSE